MRRLFIFISILLIGISTALAWDNVRLQTSDGMVVNSTNPIAVTFGTGNQTIAGNVYIGGDIEVNGDISGGTITAGGGGGVSRIDFSSNDTYLESLGIGGIYLGDANVSDMTRLDVDGFIYADKNVGIGTTSTNASLQVGDGVPYRLPRTDGSIYVQNDIEVNGAIYIGNINKSTSALAIASRGAETSPIHVNASDGSTLFTLGERSTGEGLLYLYDAGGTVNLLLSARSSIASYFTNSVGIGTAAPTTAFAVSSGAASYTNVGSGDVYFKSDLEIDGSTYFGDAVTDRMTIDAGIYQSNPFFHFKVGATCYEVRLVPTYKVSACSCSSIGM